MKTSLWFTLFSLTAVAYGAVLAPAETAQGSGLSQEADANVLEKAGKTLEAIGRLLQGEDVDCTEEEKQEIINVLKAIAAGEGEDSDEVSEYIWPIIARGVVQGGVAHGVHRWLDRRG